jgi:hypothetical protein
MAETIVRSPHNSNPDSPLRGVSPGSRSSPSNASRSDTRIAAMRRDNCKPEPVVGSGGAAEIERALKKGM